MFTNHEGSRRGAPRLSRAIRKALLGTMLTGATLFSAPAVGCGSSGVASAVKDLSGDAARKIELVWPRYVEIGMMNVPLIYPNG